MSSVRVVLKNIYKQYGDKQVIEDLNIEFAGNQIHSIFGPSGCGKTTLLQGILGIITFDSGTVSGLDDLRMAAVFQEERLLPWATVEQNMELVLENRYNKDQVREKVDTYLHLVDLHDSRYSYPRQLSGGMRQRVAIARALAYAGDLLILDEPFKGLDAKIKLKIMEYIGRKYKANNRLCLLVTHDQDEVHFLADVQYTFSGPPLKPYRI